MHSRFFPREEIKAIRSVPQYRRTHPALTIRFSQSVTFQTSLSLYSFLAILGSNTRKRSPARPSSFLPIRNPHVILANAGTAIRDRYVHRFTPKKKRAVSNFLLHSSNWNPPASSLRSPAFYRYVRRCRRFAQMTTARSATRDLGTESPPHASPGQSNAPPWVSVKPVVEALKVRDSGAYERHITCIHTEGKSAPSN
jgi:hypothetical protein